MRLWHPVRGEGPEDQLVVECIAYGSEVWDPDQGFLPSEERATFTLQRVEALDPETDVERLLILAQFWPQDVHQNPVLPLLRVMHPGFFENVLGD